MCPKVLNQTDSFDDYFRSDFIAGFLKTERKKEAQKIESIKHLSTYGALWVALIA
jgi:hypothetical protein